MTVCVSYHSDPMSTLERHTQDGSEGIRSTGTNRNSVSSNPHVLEQKREVKDEKGALLPVQWA